MRSLTLCVIALAIAVAPPASAAKKKLDSLDAKRKHLAPAIDPSFAATPRAKARSKTPNKPLASQVTAPASLPVLPVNPPPPASASAPTVIEIADLEPSSQPASTAVAPQANLQLRALEERVNALKEKIFRSKARLVLLQEAVLHGTISGARVVLTHKNEMGGSFKLVQVEYALDGAPIFAKNDPSGSLDDQDELEIFNGNIVPGNHQVSVYLVYRGNGFGIFSYVSEYKFKIKSSHSFVAEENKQTAIKIVGHEKDGMSADLKDRPAIRFDVETLQDLRMPERPPADVASGKK